MNVHHGPPWPALACKRLPALLLGTLALALLAACGIKAITPSPIPLPLPTATIGPTPNMTAALEEFKGGYPPGWLSNPVHAAGATAAVERHNDYLTATALTPTAEEPVWTPEPPPTLKVGMITDTACWSPVEPGQELFDSCWATNVAGQWIVVGVGYRGGGIDGPRIGRIWVCPEPCHVPHPDQLYPAPCPDLHITAVDGPRITLAARDPAVPDPFVFDISTLQWVNP